MPVEKQLFRQKSLDRISSPEELHDYMRVTNPRLWTVLIAIVVLLAGFLVYAATTRMESTETITFQVTGGYIHHGCIPENRQDIIKVGMPVRINGEKGKIDNFEVSIQYRLNLVFDGETPEKNRDYLITFGEEWSEPRVNEEDFPESEESAQPENGSESAQPEGNKKTTQYLYATYEDYGFTVSSYEKPELMKKLEGDYSRVRVWKIDYQDDGYWDLSEGRLATVNGYDPITAVYANVSLDNPDVMIPDGFYDAVIVTESTTPISFLWN